MSPSASISILEAPGAGAVRQKRLFLILPPDQAPGNCLCWDNARQMNTRLQMWRRSLFAAFPESARAMRLAWVLADLFRQKGYAYASDPYLAKETGIAVNKVQDTLRDLHLGGAIIRVHVAGNEQERRIYPCRSLLSDATPQLGVLGTPQHPGGQNKNNKYERLSSTALAARKAAELREKARERDEGAPPVGRKSYPGEECL